MSAQILYRCAVCQWVKRISQANAKGLIAAIRFSFPTGGKEVGLYEINGVALAGLRFERCQKKQVSDRLGTRCVSAPLIEQFLLPGLHFFEVALLDVTVSPYAVDQ